MILVPVDVPVKSEVLDDASPRHSPHFGPVKAYPGPHPREAAQDDLWSSPDDATLERMAEDAWFAGMLDAGLLPF